MANFYKDPFEDSGDYFRRQAFTVESVPPMEEQLSALEQVQPNSVDPYASEFRKGFRQGVLGLEKNAEVLARVYSASHKGRRYTVRKDGDTYSCT